MRTDKHFSPQCLLLAGLLLSSPAAYCVESMNEDDMARLHIEGLDAPAAGPTRSAVSGDVMSRSVKQARDSLAKESERNANNPASRPVQNLDYLIVGSDAGFSKSSGVFQVDNLRSDSQVFNSAR